MPFHQHHFVWVQSVLVSIHSVISCVENDTGSCHQSCSDNFMCFVHLMLVPPHLFCHSSSLQNGQEGESCNIEFWIVILVWPLGDTFCQCLLMKDRVYVFLDADFGSRVTHLWLNSIIVYCTLTLAVSETFLIVIASLPWQSASIYGVLFLVHLAFMLYVVTWTWGYVIMI